MTMISRPRTRSVYTKLFEKEEEEIRRCLQIDVLLPVARFVTLLLDLLALDDLRRPIASALSRKFISPG